MCLSDYSTPKILFFKLMLKVLCHFLEQPPGSVLVKTELSYLFKGSEMEKYVDKVKRV